MSTGRVGQRFQNIKNNGVYSSLVPSSTDWVAMANNSNYLYGKGGELIPTIHFSGIISSDDWIACTEFYTWPHKQNLDRYFYIGVKALSSAESNFGFAVSPNASSSWILPGYSIGSRFGGLESGTVLMPPKVFEFRNQFSQSALNTTNGNITQITMSLDRTSEISFISAYEAPRTQLSMTVTDRGINEDTFRVRFPIYEEDAAYRTKSVYALATANSSSFDSWRRANLYHWNNGVIQVALKSDGVPPTFHVSSSFIVATNAAIVSGSSLSASMLARRTYNYMTATLCDYAFCVKSSGSLCSGTFWIQSTADKVAHQFRLGNQGNAHTWLTGQVWIRNDGTSGSMLPEPGVVVSSLATNDRVGFRLQQTGSGQINIYAISIGEKEKGIPD